MPTPEQILGNLRTIANQAMPLAMAWHGLALAALIGVAAGWRPSRRHAALMLVLPVLCVAVLAWTHGNPFNGIMFSALALALGILGFRLVAVVATRPPLWALGLGLGMIAFGLFYPHFLETSSWMSYVYAAPTGLVPCPTLALVIGAALVADGLGSPAWTLVLATAGLFYGVFGVARLGVALDVGLIVGAGGLFARGLGLRKES